MYNPLHGLLELIPEKTTQLDAVLIWKIRNELQKGNVKVRSLQDVCEVLRNFPQLFEITLDEEKQIAYIKNIYGPKEKD